MTAPELIEPADLGVIPSLADYLEEHGPEANTLLREAIFEGDDARFRITSESMAVWAMRKLARVEARRAEHNETAQAEYARIDEWRAAVDEPLERDARFFEGLLAEWHAGQIAESFGANPLHGPVDREAWTKFREKSCKLPNGTIKASIGSGKFHADEPEMTIAWLRGQEREDLLETTPRVLATPLDKALADPTAYVELDDDGRYWLLVCRDEITDMEVAERLAAALTAGADELTLLDSMPGDLLPNARKQVAWCVATNGEVPTLRMSQQIGEHPQCETWSPIPGVRKEGARTVTIKAAPKVETP